MKNITTQFKAAVMNLIKKPISMFDLERPGEKIMNALVAAGFLPQPQRQYIPVESNTPRVPRKRI